MDTVRLSIPGCRRYHFPDRGGDGANFQTRVQTASLSRPRRRPRDQENCSSRQRWIRRDFSDQSGDGPHQVGDAASFQTMAEMARLFRTGLRGRDQDSNPRDQGGDGATFQTKAETARLLRPRRRGRDFPDQHGDGVDLRPRCRCRNFPDRGGDGATKKTLLATYVDTARLSLPGWRRHDFPGQGGVGATFKTKTETARPSRPMRRQRDQENIP